MSKVLAFRPRPAEPPIAVNGRVSPPRRRTNAELRPREHLTEAEVEALIKAAGADGRHRERDKTLILVAYTHGLRVSELISLQWSQVDFQGYLHVKRRKNGRDATHPHCVGVRSGHCAGCSGYTRAAGSCSQPNARGR